MKTKLDQMDLSELIDKYLEDNHLHNFEGTGGVSKLQKLLGDLGYKEGNYLGYNNEIINFLSDNSGAIEAIINWIKEGNISEWKENIASVLPEPEEDEEES